MQHNIIQHFNNIINLTKEEESRILSLVKVRRYKKKTMLIEEGAVCRAISYVFKGCLRIYKIDSEGIENNVYFTLEDWWVVDLKSFIEQTGARFYIETLEDCELWQLTKNDFDVLLDEILILEKWFRVLLQNALISSENRIHYKTSLKAEDRYDKFLEKYPTLESRISQRHIASYLGISPEFLSSLKSKRHKQQKP
ncbi:hypothetical protein BKI52_32425 [marine bacterium AO1-C]|nr:hypothetical protein BKI52_32425 [marine bacterium AO1-C]